MWRLLARRLPAMRRSPKRHTLPGLPTALPHSNSTLYFDYIYMYWYLFTRIKGGILIIQNTNRHNRHTNNLEVPKLEVRPENHQPSRRNKSTSKASKDKPRAIICTPQTGTTTLDGQRGLHRINNRRHLHLPTHLPCQNRTQQK